MRLEDSSRINLSQNLKTVRPSSSQPNSLDTKNEVAGLFPRPDYAKALAELKEKDDNLRSATFSKLSPLLSSFKEASERLEQLSNPREFIKQLEGHDPISNVDKVSLVIFSHYQAFIDLVIEEFRKSSAPSEEELHKILVEKFVKQPHDKNLEKTLGIDMLDLREFKRDEKGDVINTNDEMLKQLFVNWISAAVSRLIVTDFFEDLSKSQNIKNFVELRKNSEALAAKPLYKEFLSLSQNLNKISRVLNQNVIHINDARALVKAAKEAPKKEKKKAGFAVENKKTSASEQSFRQLMDEIRADYKTLLLKTDPANLDPSDFKSLNQHLFLEYSGIGPALKQFAYLLDPVDVNKKNEEQSLETLLTPQPQKKASELDMNIAEFKVKINNLERVTKDVLKILSPLAAKTTSEPSPTLPRNMAISTFLVKLLNPVVDCFGDFKPLEPLHHSSFRQLQELFFDDTNNAIQEYLGLRASSIGLPKILLSETFDFLKTSRPSEYLLKYAQLLENVYNNSFLDKDSERILIENGREDARYKPQDSDLLKVGANKFFLKQNNYEIQTMGNYAERRFLLGLQDLALNSNPNNDLIVIAPNEVGFINNRLGADALVLKKMADGDIKILALDCKAGGQKYKEHRLIKAYTLPRNDLRPSDSRKVSLANKMKMDIDQLFNLSDNQLNTSLGKSLMSLIPRLDFTDGNIFSNPSNNFYRLQDTVEAREFEKKIFEAFSAVKVNSTWL